MPNGFGYVQAYSHYVSLHKLLLYALNQIFLPDFESWHGGALSYPILLIAQVFILTWFVWTARRFSNSVISPNRRLGLIILIFSSLYFIVMLLRLLLGLTIMSEHRWFASYLPAFFHLVLASYLFLYAHFHFRHGK